MVDYWNDGLLGGRLAGQVADEGFEVGKLMLKSADAGVLFKSARERMMDSIVMRILCCLRDLLWRSDLT